MVMGCEMQEQAQKANHIILKTQYLDSLFDSVVLLKLVQSGLRMKTRLTQWSLSVKQSSGNACIHDIFQLSET